MIRSFSFATALLLSLSGVACVLLSSCGLFNTAVGVGLIKLRFGCLVEGTLIDTPSGGVAVEDLAAGDWVIGYEGEPVRVRQVHEYLEDPAASRHVTVAFSEGTEIALSARHRICGIPAGTLQAGDDLGGREVLSISRRGGVVRSFDLLTDDRGYQIGGVPVNSMIEEMAGR